ncbi:hypothetical protein [Aurantivibrio plasticivorans]
MNYLCGGTQALAFWIAVREDRMASSSYLNTLSLARDESIDPIWRT